MKKNELTQQEERALLELQCQLARLKVETSRQRKRQTRPSQSSQLMNMAQLASDMTHNNPAWKMAMTYGRGKTKLWLGAALLLWQMFANKQK